MKEEHGDKAAALLAQLRRDIEAWRAKYGPREFVRNASGDFVEREVQELYTIRRLKW